MNPRARKTAVIVFAMLGFATMSWAIFLGYLTPEMMVYFLTFRWCF